MKMLIAVCILVLAACAGNPRQAEELPNLKTVEIPDYESDRGIGWASSREAYEAARADGRFLFQQFTYVSDGLTVGAYLYRAREPHRERMPVVIFNRGSNGWAGRDELGGADLHDLLNLPREIARIQGADPSRLFLAGESRGGAMVYMALRDGFPARAAAVWGAFTDLQPLLAAGPQAGAATSIWPQYENNREELYRTRSALRWADKINLPLLIMHGGADEDIPLSQSQRMDAELSRLDKLHEFRVFEGQQHVIGGRGAERDAATVAWFERFGARAE